MISNHTALIEIVGFDFIIGTLLFRYCRAVPSAARSRLILVSAGIIGSLVNVGGLFCAASIVEMLVTFGGLPLVLLLMSYEDGKGRLVLPTTACDAGL